MRKKILFILAAIIAVCTVISTTGCKNENKNMRPGELRLESNDYRNDDCISSITYTTSAGKDTTMSAMELRTIWHALIINAEKNLENKDDNEKNIYDSPLKAEETFNSLLAQNLENLKTTYPDSHAAILQELKRADVYAFAKYVWCAVANEYVNLKFQATPHITASASVAEEK